MSKIPDPTSPIDQALKAGVDKAKELGNKGLARMAVLGLQAKGFDMMMNPEKDVMSVPGVVKDAGGMIVQGLEGAATKTVGSGIDAFKSLLSGGGNHSGPPSHGVHAQGAADTTGKVR